MKKINNDILLKILIFIGFSVFFCKLLISKEIELYVHPRIVPFVIVAMTAMIIISIILLKYLFIIDKSRKKRIRIGQYCVFIVPLLLIFIVQSSSSGKDTIKTSDINTRINNQKSSSTTNEVSEYNKINIQNKAVNDINKPKLDINNNIINVTSQNFVFSLNEILDNPDKYLGYDIDITGFIYKDQSFDDNQFVVGRFIMVCCAADMQVTGIVCESSESVNFNNDTWVKVKGKIIKSKYDDEEQPVIQVETIEEDVNADKAYVYPY